jgi:hypothetical protein
MSRRAYTRLDRRTALKWMLTAAAGATVLGRPSFAGAADTVATPNGKGYGTDPDLTKNYKPGDFWPLTLSPAQLQTTAALCAVIIPADENSPGARDVGVPDFIDEWISAPYPDQQRDRTVILAGLSWINTEARRRFGRDFADLETGQMAAICDDICHEPDAKPEFKTGAKFFARFRDLTAGGFYTTPVGMKDLKYVGNIPLIEFKGPPPELLQRLGLA